MDVDAQRGTLWDADVLNVMMAAYLVVWENEGVSNDDVFSPASCKDNDLCDVVWCERLASTVISISIRRVENRKLKGGRCLRVDSICFSLVAIKSNNGEFLSKISNLKANPNDDVRSQLGQGQSQ